MRLRTFSPAQATAIAVLSLTAVAAFGLVPDDAREIDAGPPVARSLALPALEEPEASGPLWREERVQRGDTIGSLLARAGVGDVDAMNYLRGVRPLYQLRPGRAVHVATDVEGKLAELRFLTSAGERLVVAREGDRLVTSIGAPTVERRQAMRTGEIQTSLYAAADAAGLPDAVTLALTEIFAGDVDFLKDVRKGDRFSVVYETREADGEAVGGGRILAAEFVRGGTALRAFLWRNDDGEEGYYTEDGRTSRRAFLRSPLEFSRMTSGFSLARLHPILQSWRAHRGVDYAAPIGTPVRVTSDGIVEFAGTQNGYGNVVIIQHRGVYSTLYGHLSAFPKGLRAGTRVRQGDTIGFVGATGWATGPHLHYEFRIAGQARDPETVAQPLVAPIPGAQQAAFAAYVGPLAHQLALVRDLPDGALASND